MVAATVVNPIWLVKTRLQLHHGKMGIVAMIRRVYQREGFKGFYRVSTCLTVLDKYHSQWKDDSVVACWSLKVWIDIEIEHSFYSRASLHRMPVSLRRWYSLWSTNTSDSYFSSKSPFTLYSTTRTHLHTYLFVLLIGCERHREIVNECYRVTVHR